MIEACLLKHEVHMTGPVGMSLERLQQLANWPIMRNRVRNWHNRLEPENTLFVALHNRTTLGRCTVLVLHVVKALAVGLPDINLGALNWLAIRVFDIAENQTWRSLRVVRDGAAVVLKLGIMGVEGAQDRALCAGWRLGVVDAVNEEGEANYIAE